MCASAFKGAGFFSSAGLLCKSVRVDANWESTGLEPAAIDLAQSVADCQPRICLEDAIAKIIDVGLRLKTDDIIGPEGAKKPLVKRHGARYRRPRPRDMQEKTNPVSTPISRRK